jgi:hypothetical protein
MKNEIKEAHTVGYLIELLEAYTNHKLRHVKAFVEEGPNGQWTLNFTYTFTEEE